MTLSQIIESGIAGLKAKEKARIKALTNSGNPTKWKGDDAGYDTKHQWLNKHYGKAVRCENPLCIYPRRNNARRIIKTPKRFEWSLKTGREYTRNIDDYWMLCVSCHRRYDAGHPFTGKEVPKARAKLSALKKEI